MPENDEVEMLVYADESDSESSDEDKNIEETGFSFQTVPMESPEDTSDEKLDRLCRSVNELLDAPPTAKTQGRCMRIWSASIIPSEQRPGN